MVCGVLGALRSEKNEGGHPRHNGQCECCGLGDDFEVQRVEVHILLGLLNHISVSVGPERRGKTLPARWCQAEPLQEVRVRSQRVQV